MNDRSREAASGAGAKDVQQAPGDSGEDRFIADYFAPIAGPGSLGLRDDAALVDVPENMQLVATVDTLVAGVHFFDGDPAGAIARKALRVNLSDLAAKGADPAGFLLSFAMPADENAASRSPVWLGAFAQALGDDARNYNCPLLGGDTVSTPGPLCLSVTAFGLAPKGAMALRSGAETGDRIYVSGTIGDAAIGLQVLLQSQEKWVADLGDVHAEFLVQRYREPQPRNALATAVRKWANGSMDVSDGLAGDLAKMMRVSGASARVQLADAPLSEAARAAIALNPALLDTALTGGDDYEIACTIAPTDTGAFEAAARDAGIAVTCIGDVTAHAQDDVVFLDQDERPRVFARGSWTHI